MPTRPSAWLVFLIRWIVQVTEPMAGCLSQYDYTTIIVHQDIPGMIAPRNRGTSSRYGINILWWMLLRKSQKKLMIIEVDSRNCDEAIEEIRKSSSPHVNFLNRRKHVLFYQRIGRASRSDFHEMSQNSWLQQSLNWPVANVKKPSFSHGTQSEVMKASVQLGPPRAIS